MKRTKIKENEIVNVESHIGRLVLMYEELKFNEARFTEAGRKYRRRDYMNKGIAYRHSKEHILSIGKLLGYDFSRTGLITNVGILTIFDSYKGEDVPLSQT